MPSVSRRRLEPRTGGEGRDVDPNHHNWIQAEFTTTFEGLCGNAIRLLLESMIDDHRSSPQSKSGTHVGGCGRQGKGVRSPRTGNEYEVARVQVPKCIAHRSAHHRATVVGNRHDRTRVTHVLGSAISARDGRFAGAFHTWLKPSRPAMS